MESIDMKKLETAIVYLQRIADGNNPINNLPAAEDSVLNKPNATLLPYENCGHSPMVDCPDRLTADVCAFFKA